MRSRALVPAAAIAVAVAAGSAAAQPITFEYGMYRADGAIGPFGLVFDGRPARTLTAQSGVAYNFGPDESEYGVVGLEAGLPAGTDPNALFVGRALPRLWLLDRASSQGVEFELPVQYRLSFMNGGREDGSGAERVSGFDHTFRLGRNVYSIASRPDGDRSSLPNAPGDGLSGFVPDPADTAADAVYRYSDGSYTLTVTETPEPGTAVLAGVGLAAAGVRRLTRRRPAPG